MLLKLRIALFAILVTFGLSGCSGHQSLPILPIQELGKFSKKERVNGPSHKIDELVTAYVGDQMIETVIGVRETITDRKDTVSLLALKSKSYTINGTEGNQDVYLNIEKGQEYMAFALFRGDYVLKLGSVSVPLVGNGQALIVVDSQGRIVYPYLIGYSTRGEIDLKNYLMFSKNEVGVQFFEVNIASPLVTERLVTVPGSFRTELVYNGRAGSSIKILYREYSKDMARPAFSQELTYDLSDSDIIRFRKFRLKVISADNEQIIAKVLAVN